MLYFKLDYPGGSFNMARLALGGSSFGTFISRDEAFEMMDYYFAHGGTVVDTARFYTVERIPEDQKRPEFADSEVVVGEWVRNRGLRDKVVICTKGCHPDHDRRDVPRVNAEAIRHDVTLSLQKLGVDCIDVYFLHRDDVNKPVSEIIDALNEFISAGKIKVIGTSNWTTKRILEANAYARANGLQGFGISEIQWSLAYCTPAMWGDITIESMTDEQYQDYLKHDIPVMSYSPQARGLFSKAISGGFSPENLRSSIKFLNDVNRRKIEVVAEICKERSISPAAVVLAYMTNNAVRTSAIMGCSNLEQLKDSLSDCDLLLTPEEMEKLS